MGLHILILGCPAVGKFTIGKELSKALGYVFFDNSKTVDIASIIYDYGSNEFRQYRDEMRRDFYERLLTIEGGKIKGLVSTNVLRTPENWEYFEKIETIFESKSWTTFYVVLIASESTLYQRVENASRKSKNSINNSIDLKNWLTSNKSHSQCRKKNSIIIDNSNLSISECTNLIIQKLSNEFEILPQ